MGTFPETLNDSKFRTFKSYPPVLSTAAISGAILWEKNNAVI